ncbi:hypothetical protein GCM10010222_11500 [Streptomyces tanashiensis]|uniref:hypothetical protein n=1 Tax=Streptomyces tanashiensis TaxID=67367 RepID=UPI00167755E7|nr:hypothetical protein [Streptomyces tanashiensis]GGS72398.1 hypothetical protein GCM10010222_11500 [Streptomyces tanashiensis]
MQAFHPSFPGVSSGTLLGFELLKDADIDVNKEVIHTTVKHAQEILIEKHEPGSPIPERAVKLFTANIVVAAGARYRFSEEELSQADLEAALEFFRGLFNSLWHF